MQFYIKNEGSDSPNNSKDTHLRFAKITDIEKIQNLIEPFVKRGLLLPKDRSKIETDLPRTIVYATHQQILGVANLFQYDDDLYEIRGLAIHEQYQNRGLGRKIIEKLLSDIKIEYKGKQITIFALTMASDFFLKMGWKLVKKEKFPRKIFDDCMYCKKKDECFEDAVEIILNGKR